MTKPFEIFRSHIGPDQLYLTAAINAETIPASKSAENIYRALTAVLDSCDMRILHERIFGNLEFFEEFAGIRRRYFGFGEGPFSYIQGQPCSGKGLAGIQIHAVKPASPNDHWVIRQNNLPCGYGWKRGDATYICLAGIVGLEGGAGRRQEQASWMFEKINQILAAQNIGFGNVARMWIFLEDILQWYDAFNAIRTERFKAFGLIAPSVVESEMDRLCLPASTGIGARNPVAASCLIDLLAVSGDIQVSILPGKQQRSPFRYGSAFSRGVSIREKDCDQIFVSGTAAIDEKGRSLHPRNLEAQIRKTIGTIESLIAERGAGLEDIRSATIFLKKPEFLAVYKSVADELGLARMPAVCVVADICRDELLFEMDALAVVNRKDLQDLKKTGQALNSDSGNENGRTQLPPDLCSRHQDSTGKLT
jgi:enamine deaminase RidA (YjgF/YER057c/UK114 family)